MKALTITLASLALAGAARAQDEEEFDGFRHDRRRGDCCREITLYRTETRWVRESFTTYETRTVRVLIGYDG